MKLTEKLDRIEENKRQEISQDEAQKALTEQVQKLNDDEQKFGYESTNLYKFSQEDQQEIVEGLKGDDGQQLAQSMLDSMSFIKTKEDLHMDKKKKYSHRMKQKKHRKRMGHYHHHF